MKIPLTPLDPWITRKITCPANLTPEVLEVYQCKALNETLDWVLSKSRFYQQHLAGVPQRIRCLSDLQAYPLLTAQDLQAFGSRLICVSQDEIQRIVTLQTSGTTSAPKRIYFTASDQERTVDFFDVGMTTLTLAGERVAIFLPCQTPGNVGDLLRLGLIRQGRVPLPCGPIVDSSRTLDALQSQPAECYVGSPTQLLGLARRWRPTLQPPRTVLLSTDYVPAAIVQELTRIWGCEVFEHYGTTEMGLGGGVACAAHRGYHLREADLYFEIIDPASGAALPAGEYGEVVFSTLTRRGMPLIRYRTGDQGRWVAGECPCGTPLRTLERISGRFENQVLLGNAILKLSDFDETLFLIPNLLNFSVTLCGSQDHPQISLKAQMLSEENALLALQQGLEKISALRGHNVQIQVELTPNEPGSLLKRMIIDHRGKDA